PIGQVAQQLLQTPRRGDPEIAQLLHDAGKDAASRGAADSARAYLERALQEPPRMADRARVLLDLGLVETLTRGPEAAEHLRQGYDTLGDDVDARVIAANALGRALLFTSSPKDGAKVALDAARALEGVRDDDAAGLEAFALVAVLFGAGGYELAER